MYVCVCICARVCPLPGDSQSSRLRGSNKADSESLNSKSSNVWAHVSVCVCERKRKAQGDSGAIHLSLIQEVCQQERKPAGSSVHSISPVSY